MLYKFDPIIGRVLFVPSSSPPPSKSTTTLSGIDTIIYPETDKPEGGEVTLVEDGKEKVRLSREEKYLLSRTRCDSCGVLEPYPDNPIILCDGVRCKKGYHLKCLLPCLEQVPDGDFIGPCCSSVYSKLVKSPENDHSRQSRRTARAAKRMMSHHCQPSLSTNNIEIFDPTTSPFIPYKRRRKMPQIKNSSIESNPCLSIQCNLPALDSFSPVETTCSSASVNQQEQSNKIQTSSIPQHRSFFDSHELLNEEFNSIIGLNSVKETLIDLNCKLHARRLRMSLPGEQDGKVLESINTNNNINRLVLAGPAAHTALVGNPGTGKSMIGKLLSKIFYSTGAVAKNVFIRAQRSDLVAGFIGQTALKTKHVIESARGGVLFIDEAHQLLGRGKEDYGVEAYREIMKEMLLNSEDNNRLPSERVVFVFAGYPSEMDEFLRTDAGMQSRVTYRIEFPDYTPEELAKIMKMRLREAPIGLPNSLQGSEMDLVTLFDEHVPSSLLKKYNARLVDVLLDRAECLLARRLMLYPPSSSTSTSHMSTISLDDVKGAIKALVLSQGSDALSQHT